ncbi:hypothetical protein Sros01_81340 [Streptomyces roseochromogenus]|nr:hypothetical protein Sros01_81340 [Streptomyces roseochromogenus]
MHLGVPGPGPVGEPEAVSAISSLITWAAITLMTRRITHQKKIASVPPQALVQAA